VCGSLSRTTAATCYYVHKAKKGMQQQAQQEPPLSPLFLFLVADT
jgi:hypothetical protein